MAGAGTGTVFVDTRADRRAGDIVVDTYGMTLFLEREETTRKHICRLIHQPPDSDCAREAL